MPMCLVTDLSVASLVAYTASLNLNTHLRPHQGVEYVLKLSEQSQDHYWSILALKDLYIST